MEAAMTMFHDPSHTNHGHAIMFFLQAPALLSIFLWITIELYGWKLRKRNRIRRRKLLHDLGHKEGDNKTVLGFFHPYWYGSHFGMGGVLIERPVMQVGVVNACCGPPLHTSSGPSQMSSASCIAAIQTRRRKRSLAK
jgi:hypothetical protein